ncbi:sugar O-acetyltransferase [Pisciglobus halotolerans]|uniref:Acetyltransferase n=1 Tax=Pisciglobus halotolerans TaxID=745365 RepID=A0A1I3DCW8_9LACT|nr:sugar O-acetyltransferase [Pisciglobus halotolerans]SFH84553.1 maltose O-acetyltransferase [Pisciglobus halotolerans]
MRTEKEKMLAEELYIANDEELKRDSKRGRKLLRQINQTTEDETKQRLTLLKELFKQTGESIYVEPPFYCDYGSNITIGENFYANTHCIILDVANVRIGSNVQFGPRVGLYTAGHPIDAAVRNSGLEFGKEIEIGDNVWIGANTTVNPGVKIGNNTVIGSGSVVTKDIPSDVIAVGNPCHVLREINEEDKVYWEKLQAAYEEEKTQA